MMATRPVVVGQNLGLSKGVPYFLPKAVIPITIAGTVAGAAATKPDPSTATSPSAALTSGSGSSASTMPGASAAATASPQINVTVQSGAVQPNPSAGDSLSGKPLNVVTTVGQPNFIPDPKQAYFLQYNTDDGYDDTYTLSVDSNGLLTTAQGQSQDQRGAALAAVVQFAATLASDVGTGGVRPEVTGAAIAKSPEPCHLSAFTTTINYEPGDKTVQGDGPGQAMGSRVWHLASYKDPATTGPATNNTQYVDIEINSSPGTVLDPTKEPQSESPGGVKQFDGVLFRGLSPWTVAVTIQPSDTAGSACGIKKTTRTFTQLLPNGAPTFVEDMKRELLVQKTVNLTVKNGMLANVAVSSPSTLLAAAKLPLTILQAAVSSTVGAATGAIGAGGSTTTGAPASGQSGSSTGAVTGTGGQSGTTGSGSSASSSWGH